jgi:N-acetyl-beta-hexosaminidase
MPRTTPRLFAALLCGFFSASAFARDDLRQLEAEWLASPRSGEVARVPGISGFAWSVKNSKQPVMLPRGVNLGGDFTLKTWFRLDDPSGRSALWSCRVGQRFAVMLGGGEAVEINYYDRGAKGRPYQTKVFPYKFSPGLWYELAIVSDQTKGTLYYINGRHVFTHDSLPESVGAGDSNIQVVGAYSVNASTRNDFDHLFKGVIDNPVHIARALSAEEIETSYKQATRSVPVIPMPIQTRYVDEAPLRRVGGAPSLRGANLLPPDDPGVERLRRAMREVRIGGQIVFSRPDDKSLPEHVKALVSEGVPAEGYALFVRPGRIDLVAADARGLYYGTDTLAQLLRLPEVPQVDVFDYPEFSYRAGMFLSDNQPPVTLNGAYGKLTLRNAIERFSGHRMNAIMLRLYNYAWLDDPANLQATREIVAYAKRHHLDVIPYVQFYGHAKLLLWRDIRTGQTRTIADEQHTLTGTDTAGLKERHVVITKDLPVRVTHKNGTEMIEGRDFEVVPGELNMSWLPPAGVKVNYSTWTRPYLHPDNKPFGIRRIEGGRIRSGDTVRVTYDVASGGESTNPFSPVTRELTDRIIRSVIREFNPSVIHLGVDEIWEPLGSERSRPGFENATPIQALAHELRQTYATAQSAKPGIRVMYWSDMFDANQTPRWYATWDGWRELVASDVAKDATVCPWFYGANLRELWRVNDSLDFFLKHGYSAVGASGHEPLNQLTWGQAVLERMGRYKTDGFTFTVWTSWKELPVLNEGLRAYAQSSWSPSRAPFRDLLRLRFELDALGVTASTDESAMAAAFARISAHQREQIGRLRGLAENELRMTDADAFGALPGGDLRALLVALEQAKHAVGGN